MVDDNRGSDVGLLVGDILGDDALDNTRKSLSEVRARLIKTNIEILRICSGFGGAEYENFENALLALCERLAIQTPRDSEVSLDGPTFWLSLLSKLLPQQPEFKTKPRRGPRGKSARDKTDYTRYRVINSLRKSDPSFANLPDIELAREMSKRGHEHFNFRLGDESISPSLSRGKAIWDEAFRNALAMQEEIRLRQIEIDKMKTQIELTRSKRPEPLGLLSGLLAKPVD